MPNTSTDAARLMVALMYLESYLEAVDFRFCHLVLHQDASELSVRLEGTFVAVIVDQSFGIASQPGQNFDPFFDFL